ncbi:MAG: rod shape-determining protein RodA [Lentisphaerae bacterium]|nr:rod shape-determining protein RodA [Lentisphaerota bacterium]
MEAARFMRRHDWVMILAMLALMATGVLFIYSAAYREGDPSTWMKCGKQIVWGLLGMACFFVFARLDYRRWLTMAWWVYGAGLLLLALVLAPGIGIQNFGARRWLGLWGTPLQFQPSEWMKLATALVLARYLGMPGRNLWRLRATAVCLLVVGLPMVLIVKEPDLGTAMVFVPLLLAGMFVAGIPVRTLATLVGTGALLVIVILGIVWVPEKLGWEETRKEKAARLVGLTAYQRDRLTVFLDSKTDPLGAGWNKAQSQIAVGSGRFWGKGYLKGTQNILGFLPRTVSTTDFIFSVIAEERGFVGSAWILALTAVILVSGLRAARLARDKMGRLLAVGIMTLLFCHVFINIAMTIGLMPITGIPLPLVSYGGSFMIGTLSGLGMVQSVYSRGIYGDEMP